VSVDELRALVAKWHARADSYEHTADGYRSLCHIQKRKGLMELARGVRLQAQELEALLD
jgi:hypothetical protein